MKKILLSTYKISFLFVLAGAFLFSELAFSPEVKAQSTIGGGNACSEDGPGNLYGVIMTTFAGPIYMSTQSWNDLSGQGTTNTSFYTSYNRQTGLFGGRAWSPYLGWVDFGYTNQNLMVQKRAEFESPKANPAAWGNMPYQVDLSGVVYQSDPGAFVGLGKNYNFSIVGGTDYYEDVVGAKYLDFSDVVIAQSDCNEHVDITLNNANVLYQESCSIPRPTIRWTSENVSDCQTGIGLWVSPGSRATQNTSGELASGAITNQNTPVTFTIRCIGNGSGDVVIGSAYAWCGEIGDPNDPGGPGGPGSGLVIPDYREV